MRFPFKNKATEKVFLEVCECLPPKEKVYLVGGALRNALYYSYFGKRLPQRDYDMVIFGKLRPFVSTLLKHGFEYGKIRRKNQIVVKKQIKKTDEFRFENYVYLDIQSVYEPTIKDNIKAQTNFVMNSSALRVQDLFNNWRNRVISLPGTLKDLEQKRLRLNPYRQILRGSELFAVLRFISKGFTPPPPEEIERLCQVLKHIPRDRFDVNVKKIFSYVGGEKKARRLVRKLGIVDDIFSYETVKKIKKGHTYAV